MPDGYSCTIHGTNTTPLCDKCRRIQGDRPKPLPPRPVAPKPPRR